MKPNVKFHSAVISITSLFIFSLWIVLNQVIITYPILAIICAGLISFGFYRITALFLLTFFRKIQFFKKFILGSYFMEGVWVGFFVGHDEKIRYFIETFEQDLDSLVIRGKAFKADGKYHGAWTAETTNINVKLGRLTYTYETDNINNTFTNQGIAVFSFEREKLDKPPLKLYGFSSDLFNPNKLKAIEIKLSDKTFIDSEVALKEAQKVYEVNKKNF